MIDFLLTDLQLLFPDLNGAVATALEVFLFLADMLMLVLLIVGEWKVFEKFGEKPWKSLIPYYSSYIMYKHTWRPSAFWFYVAMNESFNILSAISERIADREPQSILGSALLFLALPFGVLAMINNIMAAIRLGDSFGKGTGFKVGIALFYTPFVAVLGFSKATYLGNFSRTAAPGSADPGEPVAPISEKEEV